MEMKKDQKWGPFVSMVSQSEIPWKWYILNFIVGLVISKVSVQMTVLSGEIMQGNIFDRGLVTKYALVAMAVPTALLLNGIFGGWVQAQTDMTMRRTMWGKLIRIPMPMLDTIKPSSLTSRITSDVALVSAAISATLLQVNMLYQLALILKTVYDMSSKMVLPFIALIPWVLIVGAVSGRLVFRGQNKIQEMYSQFTGFVSERLANLRLIKSSGSEDIEDLEMDKIAEGQYRTEVYMAKINLILSPFMSSINAISTALILVYGGYLVSRNELELGQLITIYMFASTIPMLITLPIHSYNAIKRAQGATKTISEVWSSESEVFERKRSFSIPDNDIVFEGVSFGYGQEKVVSDLNFVIPKGKVTAIVGPSGSGKTTILRLLERFYLPDSGHIKFGNIPVEDIHLDEWRNSIGYVPQNCPMLSGTIRDNITYGLHRQASEEEVIRAAKLANAYDFIMKFPDGLDSDIGELGTKLSGGERQRIAIARTIIKDPDYLLLDEATCSLDAQNEAEVQSALNNMMEGRTSVVIAHNIKTIANADRIIVVDDGEVEAIGNHNELYEESPLYRRYFDLQFDFE